MGLKGHMNVARETPTFIYGDSLDMTGFTDGTGNPEAHRDTEVGVVPDGEKGAGGSFIIAQRWIHALSDFHNMPVSEQENVFGRTKAGSERLSVTPNNAHLKKMELMDGQGVKRDEITRRSTPFA